MSASDQLLVIFVIGFLLLSPNSGKAIFITKYRRRAVLMGSHLVFTTLLITSMYMGLAEMI